MGARLRCLVHTRPLRFEDPSVEVVNADLTRAEDCRRAVEGVDIVFMCAANTAGAAVMASTPLVQVTPNILMNSQLLEAAYRAGVKKFVFLSSSAAYPPSGDRPVEEREMFQGDPYDVYFAVGWMKRYTEVLCRMYSEKITPRMPCVVVRPSNLFGPYDKYDPRTSHMMAALIRRAVERQNPYVVWGTGEDVRDMIYVDDFIDGLLLAAEKIHSFEPVNIASGRGVSIREIIKIILEEDGFTDTEVRFDASKPSMAPVRLIDTRKAECLLGFKSGTDLRKGIGKTLQWYRQASADLAVLACKP